MKKEIFKRERVGKVGGGRIFFRQATRKANGLQVGTRKEGENQKFRRRRSLQKRVRRNKRGGSHLLGGKMPYSWGGGEKMSQGHKKGEEGGGKNPFRCKSKGAGGGRQKLNLEQKIRH